MSITTHRMTGGDTGALGRLPMLAPPLAALLYPFALEGFHTSVARIAEGASILSWLSAAASLALAFAMPLIAMLAAMSFSEIGRPTVAQLRAKRTALLALAAPTLFVFVGVVLTMLHDPVPDTWLWVACWAIAIALLLRSDNSVPAVLAPRPIPAPLKDPWNIRLVPHYWLGAFFVVAHLAAGARAVMMAHGVSKALANRLMVGGAVLAGLVATVIMLGMCGMRVRFV